MNAKNKLAQGKRRIERRLDKNDISGCELPMITASNIDYEIADRTRAVAAGGLGVIGLVAKKQRLRAVKRFVTNVAVAALLSLLGSLT